MVDRAESESHGPSLGSRGGGMSQEVVGIGVFLKASLYGPLEVSGIVPGGPAQLQGGINVGELLTAIDGVDVRRMDVNQVAPFIKGQVGTTITVQMLRPGASTASTVKLVRRPAARLSEGQQPNDAAASLAKAKAKGLVKNHIMEKDDDGRTPLFNAAFKGTAEDAKLLLDVKADVSAKNNGGWKPLYVAAQEGNVDFLRVLTGTAEGLKTVDVPNEYGTTPLNSAAERGHINVVDLLLGTAEGLKTVGVPDSGGCTPLNSAAEKGHVKIVDVLLGTAEGLKTIGVPNYFGTTPLQWAAHGGHVHVVDVLLGTAEGLKTVDMPNEDGWTPLHWAAERGHVNVVDALLGTAEGLKTVGVPNSGGYTPLNSAAKNGHVKVVDVLLGMAEGLKTVGVPDIHGCTPLLIAAYRGHVKIVDALLGTAEGLKTIWVQDNDGDTPFHSAAERGHVEVVNLLLRKGGQKFLHIKDKMRGGKTPRDKASAKGHSKIVEVIDQAAAAKKEEEKKRAAAAKTEEEEERKAAAAAFDAAQTPSISAPVEGVNYPPPASPTVVDGLQGMSLGGSASPGGGRPPTLAQSNFKKLYHKSGEVDSPAELLLRVRDMLILHCRKLRLGDHVAKDLFKQLEAEALKSIPTYGVDNVLELGYLGRFLWTSGSRLGVKVVNGQACVDSDVPRKHQREFCFILNSALRSDDTELLSLGEPLISAINTLQVVRRINLGPSVAEMVYPKVGKSGMWELYRGGGITDEGIEFFESLVEKTFRVPGFLATSTEQTVALTFMADNSGYSDMYDLVGVFYTISLDPRGKDDPRFRCKNVNYVERSNIADEKGKAKEAEYLFTQYSAFSVQKVERGSEMSPYHMVYLEAKLDSRFVPEDVPTCPFI